MRRTRLSPFASFVLVFLAGLLLATTLFRLAQRQEMRSARDPIAVPAPTEAHKLYLDAKVAASELLFNVAFASVAGLLGLHFSDNARARVSGHAAFAACGLLLASIYGAFLFQAGVSHCLEVSPEDMYGPVLSYPIICQFWFLFAAIVLLAMTLLRRPSRTAVILVCALAGTSPQVFACDTTCVAEWATSRNVELSTQATADAVQLVERTANAQEAGVRADCAFAASVLDEVRFTAVDSELSPEAPESTVIAQWLRAAVTSAQNPQFSPGELLGRLAAIAELWRVAAAVVELTHAGIKPMFVTITTQGQRPAKQWKRRTPCVLRLPAGKYEISAADNAELIYSATVELRDGDRKRIPLERPK